MRIEYPASLSAGLPFVRGDFYDLVDPVVFGELACYPGAGCGRFTPPTYDAELGEWLPLRRIGETASR